MYSIKIDLSDFDQKVLYALKPDLQIMLNKAAKPIQKIIRKRFLRLIHNHVTVQSVLGRVESAEPNRADLQGELGIVSPDSKILSIIAHWMNNMYFKSKPVRVKRRGLSGGFSLGMVQSDFQDVVNLRDAIQMTNEGMEIKWLEWLLINGDKVIIKDYDILVHPGYGRTGKAIMVKSNKRFWSMPKDFGPYHRDNNFATQVIDQGFNENFMEFLIQDECERAIP